ncbi:MAG: 2-polyprenylphenol 6-hydroxylase [Alphaproteobacteria bacterium]|nr:2-polyprenylphenol 6-hydroxylase [Alphaproteobacteria bacterium]MBV9584959.1 2-polyprenylphenol 6-hydroxylase [Alphaproteobacteria bacterium]
MFGLFRSGRNLARLVRIGLTLARHDALFPLGTIAGAAPVLRLTRPLRRNDRGRGRPGERLAAALTELGPSFIKLGQMLSTRADLLGDEITEDLTQLQDRLPPFPAAQARALIEAEFERPLRELFVSFDDTPVAAASIAQVHFAVTTDGVEVAVKVLRPGIARAMARDLELFLWLARLAERTQPALRRLKPVEVVETFAQSVQLEMDLRFEAAAASELAENFAGDTSFRVPRIDWVRTGRTVLTTERIGGIRVDDRAALVAAGHDVDAILRNAASAFFKQVFRDGFFHADLHPGNMFVDADGALAVVDFGIMGRLDRQTRYYLADMLIGFLSGDYRRVAEVHFEAGYVPRRRSIDAFTQACRSIGEPILGKPLSEISIARLLGQLFHVTEQFDMETQPQLLLLQKTMVLVEGVGRRLDPAVNIWGLARPLVEEWMRDNRGPEARLRQRIDNFIEALDEVPRLLRNLDKLIGNWAQEGVVLHAESLATQAAHRARLLPLLVIPLWLAAAALLAIAAAMLAR